MMGGYMLIRPQQAASEAIHLLFVGEKSKSTQLAPHPEIHPEVRSMFGMAIPVASVCDLILMKLNAFRQKDILHLETLDEAGLITSEIEHQLPPVLKTRLDAAKRQIADEKPDIEG